ncbi:MAG: WecB/TagA/CpsF family glycosyltransferase [Prevotella sp.]|nr:WecB/TagA/CpsF family glycosyltransferase [Prevotella sp.]
MKSLLVRKIIATEAMGDDGAYLEQTGRVYTFLNPVSYLDALEHRGLFERFDGIFADGSLLVAAIRVMYGKRVTRRSCDMTSIGKELLEMSAQTGKSLYYVASKQEEVEKAVKMLKGKFPKANIIGYRNGYFSSEEEMDEEARHIRELSPDFLVVGMGAIRQEEFLLRVKAAGYQGIGFTCGGFIHQTAHNETDYYPEWVDRMNVRFLYRMWKEPHTRKRYLMAGLIFPVRFVWERFFG